MFASIARNRLHSELKELREDSPDGITAVPSLNNFMEWEVSLLSPNGKPIKATLSFIERYPFVPPKVKFSSQLFHPNINLVTAELCIDDKDWTPAHTLWSFLASIQILLSEPNPKDAINAAAANLFINNKPMYYGIANKAFEKAENSNEESQVQEEPKTEDEYLREIEEELYFQMVLNED